MHQPKADASAQVAETRPARTISRNLFSLEGKVAVVTGAGGRPGGVGEVYAQALAALMVEASASLRKPPYKCRPLRRLISVHCGNPALDFFAAPIHLWTEFKKTLGGECYPLQTPRYAALQVGPRML
jgi:hypothetical protein